VQSRIAEDGPSALGLRGSEDPSAWSQLHERGGDCLPHGASSRGAAFGRKASRCRHKALALASVLTF
jgi:hypothetical protein